jgi:hypothetical protein
MARSVYGYTRCPTCGLSVPAAQLEGAGHECRAENIVAHQTLKARRSLERLEQDIAAYIETDRARNLLAFRRWCFEHGR